MLSLKSQKIDLHSRVIEMQSTIASLRDEHKTLEIAFEEKQNEIQILQERETDSIKENPEVIINLKETLKQRQAEIEDLKHRLEPLYPAVNITARESMVWENKTQAREGQGQNEHFHEMEVGQKETTKSQTVENAQDDVKDGSIVGEKSISADQGNENKDSQQEMDSGNREGNATEAISKSEVGKTIEEDSNIKLIGNEEHDITRHGLLEKLENSHSGEGRKLGMVSKGGMKMEMPGSSTNGGAGSSTGRYAGKTKEKRWRILTKSRGVETNGNSGNSRAATTRRRRISKDKRNKFPTTDTSQQVGQKYKTGSEYGSSEAENRVPDVVIPTTRISSEAGDIIGSAGELGKKVEEDRKKKADHIQQETGTMDFHEAAEDAEQAKVTEADEESEDIMEVEDIHRQEKEADDGDTFRNVFENNTEGYKDETDEPEF